jgi:hypothetical protein
MPSRKQRSKERSQQGDPSSPFIFKAIMDALLDQLEQIKGYVINESQLLSACLRGYYLAE